MIEQTGKALTYRAFFTKSKLGATGLTVTVDVYDYSRTKIVSAAAATEIGGGLYEYTLASGSNTNAGLYTAVFHTIDTTVDQQDIPANWTTGQTWVTDLDAAVSSRSTYAGADTAGTTTLLSRLTSTRAAYLDNLANLDAAISGIAAAVWSYVTRTLTGGAGSVTLLSPVLDGGVVKIAQGDDYLAADSRQLSWQSSSWPNLTGATVTLKVRKRDNSTVSFAGSVVSASQVQVELTATNTAGLSLGTVGYALTAVLANGHEVTLAAASLVTTAYPT